MRVGPGTDSNFLLDPDLVNLNPDPDLVNLNPDPDLVNLNPDPDLVNLHPDPDLVNLKPDPQLCREESQEPVYKFSIDMSTEGIKKFKTYFR